jgi:DNA-binding HxlR family transcriptional regulator
LQSASDVAKEICKVKKIKAPKEEVNFDVKRRSDCPIACTLDLIGDKWSLLIIRDMHCCGKSKYYEFLDSPERISTNILADRLQKLERNGLITKSQYGLHSQRMSYVLTEAGEKLAVVLEGLARWGLENVVNTRTLIDESELKIKSLKSDLVFE